ncbi:S-adenosyl-L-methionine-dependent methyltransferase [Syncephalis fuscata]|nr:S-adenosyl-L-methionine-dependent methyltransferase [Syncephalis fuscata]
MGNSQSTKLRPYKGSETRSENSDNTERREYVLDMSVEEIDRLNFLHKIVLNMGGALHNVPLTNPRRIVDIGSGTGVWIKDMANKFPDTQCYGIDIDIEVSKHNVMPNCKFIQRDVFEGLPFAEKSVDYIHQQLFNIVTRKEQWPQLCADYYRALVPGGQVEFAEFDGTQLSIGPAAQRMEDWISNSLAQRHLDLRDIHKLPDLLRNAGFINIEHRMISIPIGCNAGEYGQMAWLGWNSYARVMKNILLDDGIVAWEFEQTMVEWQAEVNKLPSITNMHIYSARRPGGTMGSSQNTCLDGESW